MSDRVAGSSLTHGWVATTVGALGRLHCGQSPPSAQVNASGEGTSYVSGPEQWDGYVVHQCKWTTAATRLAPANSIFITVKGSGVGTLFPGVAAAIGRDIYAFEPHRGIDASFVYRALQYSIQDVIAKARGDIPGLSKGHILDHPISVPDAKTQRNLASKIDELFSDIEEGERALERVQKLVERYRQSILKAAVTGELTREWREKHRSPLESGEALLQRLLKERRTSWQSAELAKMLAKGKKPTTDEWLRKYVEPGDPKIGLDEPAVNGWACLSIEQATLAERPIAYGVLQPGSDLDNGVRLVRVCDVADGVVDTSTLKRIDPAIAADYPRTRLKGGEVLLTIVGTIGRTAIVPAALADANVARAVAVLMPLPSVRAEWLEFCLRNEKTRQLLTGTAREVARKTLNLEQLRECAIPVPSIAEQDEAISRVKELLSQAANTQVGVERQQLGAGGLRQAVLKAAFAGQLVRQDTADEPASALLARIAAKSPASPPPRRSRRGV